MAENNEKLGINLDIAGEKHHFVISRDKEKHFREAAELINRRYNAYRESYQNQTPAKYNAVVLLDIAVRYLQSQEDHSTEPIMESIRELNSEIEELLGDNK